MSDNSVFVRSAHSIILLSGWRRSIAAFLAGICGSLALAPLHILPAFVISMSVVVWLIDGCVSEDKGFLKSGFAGALKAARLGWWFGFGYFLGSFWWLGAAFLVEADKFAWALPLGVVGLPAGLAVFPAAGFLFAWVLWSSGSARIFALATGLGAAEWLRGSILSGFPWNDMGMVLGGNLLLGQIGSLFGLHGLTFLAVAIAAAPATLVDTSDDQSNTNLLRRPRYRALLVACVGLIAVIVYGLLRLGANPTDYVQGVQLRLMQPNLQQNEKFRPEVGQKILADYLKLSDRSTSPQSTGIATVTHLFWPESPFPFLLTQQPEALAKIGNFLPRSTTLVTGAARAELDATSARSSNKRRPRYFNSIHVMESGGVISQTYDKIKLVPFGEYLPMKSWLEKLGVTQFVHIPGGFAPGTDRRMLSLPLIGKIAPLICYEAIFPGVVSSRAKFADRPNLIVNVTNDGWFGPTIGPHQHLAQARLRSIEEGLPMVRVANTGISAVIDPVGRFMHTLRLGTAGIIDSKLPRPLKATFFSRHPIALPLGLAGFFVLCSLLFRRQKVL